MRSEILIAVALAAGLLGCAGTQRTAGAEYQLRLAMAEQLATQGDWAGAYRAADALHREVPEGVSARLLRARALRHTGARDEAEAALRELVAEEPKYAAAHAELAVLCEHARRSDEALVHHKEAVRLEPRSPRWLNNLGFALHLRGRSREAIPVFEDGLRIDPADARLRNNLAFALAASGDFTRARQQFQLAGNKAQARINLGLAYERAGNLLQAYEQYLEAVQLDATSPVARGNLEHVARELGRDPPGQVQTGDTPGASGAGMGGT